MNWTREMITGQYNCERWYFTLPHIGLCWIEQWDLHKKNGKLEPWKLECTTFGRLWDSLKAETVEEAKAEALSLIRSRLNETLESMACNESRVALSAPTVKFRG